MPIKRTTLSLHKNIIFGNIDDTQKYVPAGDFALTQGHSFGAYDLNCLVKITFDGEILFHGKGGETLKHVVRRTGDGVKEVKLILDAMDLPSGSVVLGGFGEIEEEI